MFYLHLHRKTYEEERKTKHFKKICLLIQFAENEQISLISFMIGCVYLIILHAVHRLETWNLSFRLLATPLADNRHCRCMSQSSYHLLDKILRCARTLPYSHSLSSLFSSIFSSIKRGKKSRTIKYRISICVDEGKSKISSWN